MVVADLTDANACAAPAKGYARPSLQVVENTNRVSAELDQAKGNGLPTKSDRMAF
jgi:hypothetical protein